MLEKYVLLILICNVWSQQLPPNLPPPPNPDHPVPGNPNLPPGPGPDLPGNPNIPGPVPDLPSNPHPPGPIPGGNPHESVIQPVPEIQVQFINSKPIYIETKTGDQNEEIRDIKLRVEMVDESDFCVIKQLQNNGIVDFMENTIDLFFDLTPSHHNSTDPSCAKMEWKVFNGLKITNWSEDDAVWNAEYIKVVFENGLELFCNIQKKILGTVEELRDCTIQNIT